MSELCAEQTQLVPCSHSSGLCEETSRAGGKQQGVIAWGLLAGAVPGCRASLGVGTEGLLRRNLLCELPSLDFRLRAASCISLRAAVSCVPLSPCESCRVNVPRV